MVDDEVTNLLGDSKSSYPTDMERYAEFRMVFLASDAGKRVLKDIMIMAGMVKSTSVRGDPYETYRLGGERDLGLKIAKTVFNEPRTQVTQQNSTEENVNG